MKVGYFQFSPRFGDVKYNIDYVVEKLSGVEADLMVLPELFSTGYQFLSKEEIVGLSEKIPDGNTTQALIGLSKTENLYIVAGLAEEAEGAYFNSAILTGPEGFVGKYRKTHLFGEEKLYFSPGDTGFKVFDIGQARLGIMICFDWFFPESVRSLALSGADVVCHCANLVLPYCPDAMITRCLENRVFAITANRFGSERRGDKGCLAYIGKSEIVTPDGKVLVRAGTNKEEIAVLEIDPLAARNKKISTYNNILSDRRSEYYNC